MAITTKQDTQRLALASKFYRALGDPSRLKILDALLDGEKNVSELVEVVGSSQGRVSNHLACLKQCGFVDTRRDGKYIYYRVADEQVQQLLEVSQLMIAKNAERIWACTRVDMTEDSWRRRIDVKTALSSYHGRHNGYPGGRLQSTGRQPNR